MGTKSKEELLNEYEEAKQKVESIKNYCIIEQMKIKKFDHHSS
jgi:hypothetical protein